MLQLKLVIVVVVVVLVVAALLLLGPRGVQLAALLLADLGDEDGQVVLAAALHAEAQAPVGLASKAYRP